MSVPHPMYLKPLDLTLVYGIIGSPACIGAPHPVSLLAFPGPFCTELQPGRAGRTPEVFSWTETGILHAFAASSVINLKTLQSSITPLSAVHSLIAR